MQKIFLLLLLPVITDFAANAQSADVKAIHKILDDQTYFWNKGDLDNFVNGYWNNDSVMFIGSSGVVYGYQNTLQRYKKTYSDSSKMGKLRFQILQVNRLSAEFYFVVGKWMLSRTIGDISGHFSLLFRKINGQWKIIADHSS